MSKRWAGSTPWDTQIPPTTNARRITDLQSFEFAQLEARKVGYTAAMNSPEVRAMYEWIHSQWLGEHWQDPGVAEVHAAYEAGLEVGE